MPHQTNIFKKKNVKNQKPIHKFIYENIEKDFAVDATESVVSNGREKLPDFFFHFVQKQINI